jgi:hypothetical protein
MIETPFCGNKGENLFFMQVSKAVSPARKRRTQGKSDTKGAVSDMQLIF